MPRHLSSSDVLAWITVFFPAVTAAADVDVVVATAAATEDLLLFPLLLVVAVLVVKTATGF